MLSFTDYRLWLATGALAAALVMMAGGAHGTVRCGYYAGRGDNCFAEQDGSATKIFRQMADEGRRCSYFEPACRVRQSSDRGHALPAGAASGLAPPPRNPGFRPPQRSVGKLPQPSGG